MRRFAIGFLILLAMPLSVEARAEVPPQAAEGVAVFEEVWRTARDRFYDPGMHGLDWEAVRARYRPLAEAADSEAARAAVINRMLSELGASHTAYYTADDPAYYQLLDIFSGSLHRDLNRRFPGGVVYPGIGIFTRESAGRIFVSGVLAGLPADTAGLEPGDEILSVDGGAFEPVRSFAGKVGRTVSVSIRRTAQGAPETVEVAPATIRPDRAFLEAMEKGARVFERGGARIGYVRVWSYAGRDYQELLERLIATGPIKDADALVWDLRDGWGGAQADYLDPFIGAGPTVAITGRDGRTSLANVKWRKPVAMLINEGTRSGKEILAYGFRKYGLGELVGARTAGAVLAASAFLMQDGSLLLLAVADVRVDGERLEGVGVAPTVEVPFALEYADGRDPQLDAAIALLARAAGG